MEALNCVLSLLRVPRHKDVPGNKLADQFVKATTNLHGPCSVENVFMNAAKSIVRRHTKDPPAIKTPFTTPTKGYP